MIRHIFKIIWTERKINLWILLELILVFCTLWFCVDYLYFMAKRYFEPRGFDIEHVYQINIGINPNATENNDPSAPKIDIWTALDRIKAYPDVENACISIAGMPYSGSYWGKMLFLDTMACNVRNKLVSPEYFDVFRIDIINGKLFTWDDVAGGNMAVISDGNGSEKKATFFDRSVTSDFFGMPIETVKFFFEGDDLNLEGKYTVTGIAERTKENEYTDYAAVAYFALKRDEGRLANGTGEINVRLKPEADHDFISRFTKDMTSQLEIGKYYLMSIESLQDKRDNYIKYNKFDDNLNSMYAILTFVVINIFLAVIGTFWFRTRSRRNEIGIRMAHGASKMSIKSMFSIETLLLLVIASVIGAILCINISMVNILTEMKLPVAQRENPATGMDYLIDYALTFLILSVISFVAVLYPATRASKIQPTEALKSE